MTIPCLLFSNRPWQEELEGLGCSNKQQLLTHHPEGRAKGKAEFLLLHISAEQEELIRSALTCLCVNKTKQNPARPVKAATQNLELSLISSPTPFLVRGRGGGEPR